MFRKIVSNLAFSPALVGQLSFYAKRLKKEEATRRIGLIFTILALIVQSFAVFSPPEPANASSDSSFISGGFSTISQYLGYYDGNHNNIRDLFNALGVSRSDVQNATLGEINSKGIYSWALTPHFSAAQGERTYTVAASGGGTRTFYYRPLNLWDTGNNVKTGSYYPAYIGKTSSGMWFALMKLCGNIVLKVVPPEPVCPAGTEGSYPNCSPIQMCQIPGKTSLRVGDPRCKQDAVARCERLTVTALVSKLYQFNATGSADYGATISGYTYVVKRGNSTILTQKNTSTQTNDQFIYNPNGVEGDYTVELAVNTSLGDQTDQINCVRTFHIAPPEMCPQHPSITKENLECQPCPGDNTLWIKDDRCSANVIYTKTAGNTTQNKSDATQVQAQAGDKVVYTLNVQNTGKLAATVPLEENLSDVLDYAQIIDVGGGSYDTASKKLTWPTLSLPAGGKQSRMFTIQLLDTIPSMGQGTDDKTSYDCRMDNTFGNTISIDVACPAPKQIESAVSQLPHTGPRENMIFAGLVAAIVTYFYARSRQVKKEIRLIRRDFNAGTI